MKHLITPTATALLLTAATAMGASADGHGDHHMMKAKKSAEMSQGMSPAASADFDAMDTSADGRIDFTEFSNYLEREYGYSAADSAKEYVRLSGDTGVITDRTFAGTSFKKMDHTHLASGEFHKGTDSTLSASSLTTRSSSQPTAVMGTTTTSYGRFGDYDMNGDGQVSFSEYSKARSKAGIKSTRAAQEFIRVSNGNGMFTQSDFDMAVSTGAMERNYYRAG